MVEFGLKQKKIDFLIEIKDEVPVMGFNDERRLKQILLNLLSNA